MTWQSMDGGTDRPATDELASPKEVFIVRLWRETPESLTWRGEARNVRTGRVVYAQSADRLLAAMLSQLDQAGQEAGGKGGLK